ncbi:hypothetical protein MKEN_01366700 [Mycena kentingensis (nom. inval.)]|nr:hypothetical protein MKEN_01366700 [Mycena kentingensis (nom. inval.)]
MAGTLNAKYTTPLFSARMQNLPENGPFSKYSAKCRLKSRCLFPPIQEARIRGHHRHRFALPTSLAVFIPISGTGYVSYPPASSDSTAGTSDVHSLKIHPSRGMPKYLRERINRPATPFASPPADALPHQSPPTPTASWGKAKTFLDVSRNTNGGVGAKTAGSEVLAVMDTQKGCREAYMRQHDGYGRGRLGPNAYKNRKRHDKGRARWRDENWDARG